MRNSVLVGGVAAAGVVMVCARVAAGGAGGAGGGGMVSREDEVRALVSEVMADAETRSSLLQGGAVAVAGHDGRFFVASADGSFRLNVGGQIQLRYWVNLRDEDGAGNSEDAETGFTFGRRRIWFDGTVFDSRLSYRVMADARTDDGDMTLQDVWMGYRFDGGWSLRAGQGITAFLREWYMGDTKLLTFERSLQALVFGQNRSQFVDLKYQTDESPVRGIVTFSDGFRSANTELGMEPAEYALTGRAEWKFAGEWKQVVDEFRSVRGSDFAGVLGGAVHYEEGEDRTGVDEEQGLFAWTGDVLLKGDGWNAMVSGVGYHVTDEAGVSGADFDDYGLLVQGGALITDEVELIGRYDVIVPDDERAANDSFTAITAGLNWYFHGQAAKLSVAAVWSLDETTNTRAGNFGGTGARNPTSPSFGVLPSAERDQVAFVWQFQLLF